jgi:glycosyltransferase involved in cell wall biosynthesis
MSARKKIIWIDWGHHLRSQTLSRRLGVELEEIRFNGPRLWRYILSMRQTLGTIRGKFPDVVIATNPSIVLGLFLLLLRNWHHFTLISDAHYFGVSAARGGRMMQRLLNFHNRCVDRVIVTNDRQARFLEDLGAKTYVCQDPLPQIPVSHESMVVSREKSVFLICSYDDDEPYEVAFDAFLQLKEEGFLLFVSGNHNKATNLPIRYPWVRFLGFLPNDEYYWYLMSSSVIMDLTTMEDCLVCGAYEALAAGKPLIVSRTIAISEYFGEAVILTDNTSEAIRKSVLSAFEQRQELAQRARDWVSSNGSYMDERVSGLRALLSFPRNHI